MVCEMVARLAHEWERMKGSWMVEHSVAMLDDSKVAMMEIHLAPTSVTRLAAK